MSTLDTPLYTNACIHISMKCQLCVFCPIVIAGRMVQFPVLRWAAVSTHTHTVFPMYIHSVCTKACVHYLCIVSCSLVHDAKVVQCSNE